MPIMMMMYQIYMTITLIIASNTNPTTNKNSEDCVNYDYTQKLFNNFNMQQKERNLNTFCKFRICVITMIMITTHKNYVTKINVTGRN